MPSGCVERGEVFVGVSVGGTIDAPGVAEGEVFGAADLIEAPCPCVVAAEVWGAVEFSVCETGRGEEA